MTYASSPQPGQNNLGAPRQNLPRDNVRAYQYRPIQPNVPVEAPMTYAPTFGQYVRSDIRGTPGGRRVRWPGAIAFWLGLLSIPLLWVVAGIFLVVAFEPVAAALSVVAIFFGLVAFVTGSGRGLAFWGIVLALIGNIYVIRFVLSVLGD